MAPRLGLRTGTMGCVALLLCSAGSSVAGQDGICNRSITPAEDEYYKYKWRPGRCEGLFLRPYAGTSDLDVVSFVRGTRPSATFPSPLRVRWDVTPSESVHIEVRHVGPRGYLMDFGRAGPGTYEWDTQIARDVGLDPAHVGYLALLGTGSDMTVHIAPLDLGVGDSSASYEVLVVLGREFKTLSYQLRGLQSPYSFGPVAVREGYLPAGKAVSLTLPALPAGLVELRIGGVLAGDVLSALPIVLHVPGRR